MENKTEPTAERYLNFGWVGLIVGVVIVGAGMNIDRNSGGGVIALAGVIVAVAAIYHLAVAAIARGVAIGNRM